MMMSAESNSEKSVSYQKKDGRGLFSRDMRHMVLSSVTGIFHTVWDIRDRKKTYFGSLGSCMMALLKSTQSDMGCRTCM